MSEDQPTESNVQRAHQRARHEAISVIDTERQRLANLWHEASGPVRESLARRASYLGGLIDRLNGWRHTSGSERLECCEACGVQIPDGEAERDVEGVVFCGPCWETIDWGEEQ